ncbi:MAG: hypothetical protein ACYTFY_20465 [Planctomycetota bacterium]|jgi:hypothetical protein
MGSVCFDNINTELMELYFVETSSKYSLLFINHPYILSTTLICLVMVGVAIERLLFESLSTDGQEIGYWDGVQGEAHSQGIIILIFMAMFLILMYLKRKSILSKLMKSRKIDKGE